MKTTIRHWCWAVAVVALSAGCSADDGTRIQVHVEALSAGGAAGTGPRGAVEGPPGTELARGDEAEESEDIASEPDIALPEVDTATRVEAAATVAAARRPNAALRVMTWNARTKDFGPADWAKVIGNQHPDVLGMQEVCVQEVQELVGILSSKYHLNYRASYGPARKSVRYCPAPASSGVSAEFGNAMLTLTALGKPTGRKNAIYDHRGDDEQRSFHALTLRLPDGTPVRFVNTHISYRDAKGDQLDQLASEACPKAPCVVLGDFNTTPNERDNRIEDGKDRGRKFLDAMNRRFTEVEPKNEVFTFPNDPKNAQVQPTSKIDYIYLRGLKRIGAVETYWTASSDHRPKIVSVQK